MTATNSTASASKTASVRHLATVLDDRALFGHPRGLGLLFVVEMWERFSYYGMRAILVLYLINALRWDTARAASLYGTYTMLVYLTPLIGGYIADRLIGTRRGLVWGGAAIAAGHFVLAIPSMATFPVGLGLIIAGTGLFKPNASTMVGQMYNTGDPRRDSGFTIFYMGINVGGFIGPLVCGYLAQNDNFGWHWGFAAAGVGMVIGLAINVWGRNRYLPGIGLRNAPVVPTIVAASSVSTPVVPSVSAPGAKPRQMFVDAALGAAAGVLVAIICGGLAILGLAMGAAVGAALGVTLLGSRGVERKHVVALFLVAFFVVFFWAAYEQAGSSMNLFADRHTNLDVGGFHLPSSWFQSLNPLLILICAPLFAALWTALGRRGREPSTALKMVGGLVLLGCGFLILAAGGAHADTGVLVSPWWLVGAYFLHTLGELCLSPVGLSYVSKMAPARFASLLMGAWFLANAAANKIAGALAAYTPMPGEARSTAASGLGGLLQRVSATNVGFYSIFVVSSFTTAVVMLMFVPLLKRLTANDSGSP